MFSRSKPPHFWWHGDQVATALPAPSSEDSSFNAPEISTQDNIHYQNKIVNKIKGLMRSGQKSYSYSENLNIYVLHMLTVLNEMLLSEPKPLI